MKVIPFILLAILVISPELKAEGFSLLAMGGANLANATDSVNDSYTTKLGTFTALGFQASGKVFAGEIDVVHLLRRFETEGTLVRMNFVGGTLLAGMNLKEILFLGGGLYVLHRIGKIYRKANGFGSEISYGKAGIREVDVGFAVALRFTFPFPIVSPMAEARGTFSFPNSGKEGAFYFTDGNILVGAQIRL